MPQIAGKQLRDGTVTATQCDVTTGTISTINAGDTSSDGTAAGLSRRDHQHPVSTGTASGLNNTSTSTEGSSSSLARSDHTHAIDSTGTLSTINAGDTGSDGSSATGFAKKDHEHAVATAAAVGITATNAEGDSTSLARANHTHKLQEVQEAITAEAKTTDGAITDTLDNAPRTGSVVHLFLNGVKQEYGAGKDYTVSGQTITWLAGTGTAVDLAVDDVLVAVYST